MSEANSRKGPASAGPVVLLSRMKARPGQEQQLAAAIAEFYATVRAEEPGCLTNIMHVAAAPPRGDDTGGDDTGASGVSFSMVPPRPGVFVFYEVYRDGAAAVLHPTTPHFQRLRAELQQLVEGPIELEFLTRLDGFATAQ